VTGNQIVDSLGLLGLAVLLLLQRRVIQRLREDRDEARKTARGLARQNRRLRTWQRQTIRHHWATPYHLAAMWGDLDPEFCQEIADWSVRQPETGGES
jgi:hypothetical protein